MSRHDLALARELCREHRTC